MPSPTYLILRSVRRTRLEGRTTPLQRQNGFALITVLWGATFAGYPLRLAVQDEAGKIDLNTAQDELLRSAGADPETASALKDRILDWREPGKWRQHPRRLSGRDPDHRITVVGRLLQA